MIKIKPQHKQLGGVGLSLAFPLVMNLGLAKVVFDDTLLVHELQHWGYFAPMGFILIFATALALGFPGNLLAIAGGTFFGLIWGTVWSLVGSTLGAVVAFCVTRYVLGGWGRRWFDTSPLLKRLNRTIARYPFSVVLFTRFSPLSPFSLVNFLFGLTPVNLPTYTVATFLGLIPLTLAYSWLGVSGRAALSGGDRLSFYCALVFLTLLSLLPILLKRNSRREEARSQQSTIQTPVQE